MERRRQKKGGLLMNKTVMREAKKVEVCALVDNYSDFFLEDSDVVKRLRIVPPSAPLAEPGLSFLIKVYYDSEEHTVLLDAGISPTCLLHNAQTLASSRAVVTGKIGVTIKSVEAAVLSHGHFDHFGGLLGFLTETKKEIPLFLHPCAFVRRRFRNSPQMETDLPALSEMALVEAGAKLEKVHESFTLASDLILISGEVERNTEFEKGMPEMEAKINDEWVPDPFYDDQGVAINVKNKGLIVIGGCSHAGIINTVKHFRKITGVNKVHAVLGGFHLSGENEKIIGPTIEEMKAINIDYVVPMHCTGWKAINHFAREMPEQFILNNVGSTYIF
jgi:7,8-dihydropterin-6-yl-methyl-4-(beta-D-ribofuranosyl)aminobenzene 5'-phosphate synthase